MDRLNQLRGEAGGSRDSTLDTSSPPSEAFMTANESSSKYFSLSEVDSTFDISPIKDISLASATVESEKTLGAESDQLISNLSPIGKKSDFDTYKIGKQIEAANILSGGVDIFDDNDNSYDGDELVIDDNAEIEEKSNPDLKLADSQFKDENLTEATLVEPDTVPSKDTEVILQIDGKNVDAIDIGNGLYLYRKEGQEELAAVQIIDDDQQQPSFKFLKVRENNEGNLEVYEEIQIEVPKEVPIKEEKVDKNISHVPIKDISKVMSDSTSNKIADRKIKTQNIPKPVVPIVNKELESETNKESQSESKSDSNINKKMKFSESRKSPVIGSFKPMTFHSTPNKEGIPLTKTMVDQQLHPSRHSDNVKKTIEVHTDSVKQRILESPCKQSKDLCDDKEKHKDSNDSCNVAPLTLENKDIKRALFKESPNTGKNMPEEKLIEKVEKDNQTNKESLPNKEGALAVRIPDNTGSSSNKIVDSTDIVDSSTKEIKNVKEPEANKIVVNKNESKIVVDSSLRKEQNTTEKPEDIVLNKEDSKDVVDCSVAKELTIVKNIETNVNAVNKIIIPSVSETDVVLDQPQENKLNLHDDELVLNKKPEDEQHGKNELSKVESSNKADNKNAGTSNLNKLEKQTVELQSQSDTGITQKVSSDTNLNITTVDNVAETVHSENLTNKDIILSIDSQKVEKSIVQEKKSNSTDIKKDEVASIKDSSILEEVVPLTTKKVNLVSAKEIVPLSTTEVALPSVKETNLLSSKEDSQLTTDVTSPKPKEVEKIVSKLPNPFPNKIATSESQSVEASQHVTESSKNKNDLVSQSEKKPVTNPETKISVKIPEASKPKESIKDIKAEQKPKEVVKDKSSTLKKDCTHLTEQRKINVETSIKPLVKSVESSTANIAPSEPPKNASKVDSLDIKNKEDIELKKQDVKPAIQQDIKQHITQVKNDVTDKKAVPKLSANTDQKPINNNHAPVPFGKWTDVNRQAFLNKIKESKVPTNSSNGKQIKNSNDLNRRDVLKKIDSQRQAQELANMNRLGVKKESAFTSKSSVPQDCKSTVKSEIPILKNNSAGAKKSSKQEPVAKAQTATTSTSATVKKESVQRKEINNQDLIDKTIEDIINRAVPAKNPQEETNQAIAKDSSSAKGNDLQPQAIDQPISQTTLDAIEMKMNELHGIPFIERPAHELPHVPKPAVKSFPKSEPTKAPVSKPSKLPNLLPFVSKVLKGVKNNVIDVDSEEEVIEHEPITGDMDLINADTSKLLGSDKSHLAETVTLISADSSKKETIITEKDFDKFVRRNSINYENCLTVNFDSNEPHHNVVQTIVQKDSTLKTYSKMDNLHSDTKPLSSRKHEPLVQNSSTNPGQILNKFENFIGEDDCNKNYQSKVKMAYQTAMTAKRQLERPITIIEDRPVKVVFMDSNAEYISSQLNVQGQELSPSKKPSIDLTTTQASDSLDSDTLDSIDEVKVLDDTKVKTKHQRKQVLTPVETPELELIAPGDLGIEVSPKKKRRTEERVEKNTKTLVPKKSYLLGRGNTTDESSTKAFDLTKSSQRDPPKQEDPIVSHKNTASAIDSLVKAAELLETQSASITSKSPDVPQTPDSQQNTPIKRGRGRPRKYPLPERTPDKSKVPSPPKKPRLIDAKVLKSKDTDDDDDDDGSTDDEMIKENWTMGKINENIVCPICNKLFRSENVVFKHVKHCTGPSPSRSDSDNKSPRRLRYSQESDTKSFASKSSTDMDIDETITLHNVRKKRKSKDSSPKVTGDKDDVIVIEDTPVKPKIDRREELKPAESRKTINKHKVPDKATSLVCEFCGKTFRQLSYLVNHKLQHGKEDSKKNEEDSAKTSKSVFSCETCKKEFRKLHHLVQHRIIIHNPSGVPTKMTRKSSLEQNDHKDKTSKDQNRTKQTDDPSAAFRCEPCDKSFRKLHHLVEHRETHDGINRQKSTTTTTQSTVDKLPPPPQCDICKKTFRKLHHLIEHKEQHLETSSEKSDDKSVKSCLSTKDIIHECSLCYMVFPNEHSLNKHTIFCQRKKRQSATKQLKQSEEVDKLEADKEITNPEENKIEIDDDVTIVAEEIAVEKKSAAQEIVEIPVETKIDKSVIEEKATKPVEPKQVPTKESPKFEVDTVQLDNNKAKEIVEPKVKPIEELPNLPVKVKKIEDKEPKPKIQDASKKKTPLKEKAAPSTTKRHKPHLPPPEVADAKPAESSDDDEVRYMLNPDYKFEGNEGKLFMKVRANKRNSLQIERPNSKDLVKRRISLQHPPKVPRLKPKPIQNKPVSATAPKAVVKPPKLEPVPSSDSDDSDVKYSFPKPPSDVPKPSKNAPETSSREVKKTQSKSLAEKRKSLSSIAKRKSLGKAVGVKHKVKASPLKQVKKRTAEVEHRCDCGQLFSSAALLSRHTTLAHTPPRIRRRRSPLPEVSTKTIVKPQVKPRKSIAAVKTRPSADSRKSSVRSDTSNPTQPSTKRKSSIKAKPKTPIENRKSPKTSDKTESVKSATSNVKLRRYAAHKGVPVPEKMRKLMEKSKK